ncbi:P-loop containing nucleoside triphosphate hydrolase protein [Penicillium verhagenii]|uniref:P-loop containing nucleoside triphosphate hydrolase protein n=1 Tax=Penicillium verhagenii TaxID=1562060 RepID=UPI00254528A1|nr:P-loop containing nucleoside triphosphate hydrolase protein [Penicillium verhagenii]KAJ5936628.1 P-loop containing nucleoside triphosphate hydrolase protein [Penicillium verhagenii]
MVLLHLSNASQCQISTVNVSLIIAKTSILILELQSKRSILREPWQHLSLEETESVFSQSFYWWVNPLLRKGYSELLTLDTIPSIPTGISSDVLRERMKTCWEGRSKPEKRYSLAWSLMQCTIWDNLRVIPYMISAIALRYAQPVLISQLIRFVTNPPADDHRQIQALKLVLAVVTVYFGLAILNGRRDSAKRRVVVAAKGSLISIIHEKALRSKNDDHSAITLMGNDAEDVPMAMGWLHTLWSSILAFALGLYLLTSKLGWCGKYVSKNFVGTQRTWSDATQTRIGLIKTILENIKSIKMMGFIREMEAKAEEARDNELSAGLATYWLDVLLAGCASFLNVVGPAITLGIYTISAKWTGGAPLDTDRVFTSFALIQMVTLPANSILFGLPDFIAAIAGLDRIQKYLLEPEHEDKRLSSYVENQDILPSPSSSVQKDSQNISVRSVGSNDDHAIVLESATLRYHDEGRSVLNQIDLKIETGSLVAVVGVVGSGKTTLARAILGELPLNSGSVSTSSRNIAFCAQTPWLRNGTVRDIIAGPPGSTVTDEDWYRRVLYACDLEYDLAKLPNGDKTLVGNGGSSISGGQKQRVALARAIYSRLDVLILDDVLSALDSRTTERIIQRLFGPIGLLRQRNKTVILITHQTQFLKLFDRIITLGVDGSISEQYQFSTEQYEFSTRALMSAQTPEDICIIDEQFETSRNAEGAAPVSGTSSPQRSMDEVRKVGDSAVYQHYAQAIGKFRLMVVFFIMISSATFAMIIQNWLRWWTADENAAQRTWFYLSLYLVFAIGHWLSLTGISTVSLLIVPTSGRSLHSQLLKTVMGAPLSFITTTDIGTTLSRFSQDMKQIDRRLPSQVAALGSQAFKLLAQIILLYMAQTFMLLTLPVLLLSVYVIQKIYLYTSRQLQWLAMGANSLPSNNFLETVHGITTIRAFGWSEAYALDNMNALDTAQKPSYTLLAVEQWLTLVLDLIVATMALINAVLIVIRTDVTPGEVGIIMNVLLAVNGVLLITVKSWANFDASLGVVSRIQSFTASVIPESEPTSTEEHLLPASWPSEGVVHMKNIVARYDTQEDPSTMTNALDHVSLDIMPGRTIRICGRTGSGKSSLLLSILRLLDLSEGSITIDNIDTTRISREILRSRLITIPQDPFILPNDSIRDNLDPLGIASSDEICTALEKVHLRFELDSKASNIGLTPSLCLDVSMKEWPLSHGQLQLLSLARALLLRSSRGKVVLLDEATSNVDTKTHLLIQEVIRQEFQGYTVIMIVHRQEGVPDTDTVVMMDQGHIVD